MSPDTSEKPIWQQNLKILWFGCFITGIGLSLITPFLPLYIDTLENFTKQELSFWSGSIIAVSFLMTALASPLWGKLADRYGRKPMLLRAALGMSVIMMLTGLADNVIQLLIVRAIFGMFSGFISNATALIAAQTPKQHAGRVLGTLNIAGVSGVLIGPIFGGIIASALSYDIIFILTGIIIFFAFLVVLIFVKENFVPLERGKDKHTKSVIRSLSHPEFILAMFLATFLVQTTNMSINPILSLYVREIVGNNSHMELLSGIVAAAPGLTTILVAPKLGALGDRIGTHKVLFFGFSLAAIVFIPMFFVAHIWQLVALRLVLGIANGALLPGIQALISRNTPEAYTSRVFSYQQSAQAMGSVLGPITGSFIAAFLDYRYVFLATAIFALTNLLIIGLSSRKRQTEETEE